MTEYQKRTDILIEKLKQSKRESKEESRKRYESPEFQEILSKLRALNSK